MNLCRETGVCQTRGHTWRNMGNVTIKPGGKDGRKGNSADNHKICVAIRETNNEN